MSTKEKSKVGLEELISFQVNELTNRLGCDVKDVYQWLYSKDKKLAQEFLEKSELARTELDF